MCWEIVWRCREIFLVLLKVLTESLDMRAGVTNDPTQIVVIDLWPI